MIQIPNLPFASTITGGEPHAAVVSRNKAVFNTFYYSGLYRLHRNDTVQYITNALTCELMQYTRKAHSDMVEVLFDKLLGEATQGVICHPVPSMAHLNAICTMAYIFDPSSEDLSVVVSLYSSTNDSEVDIPFIAFTAGRIPNTKLVGISFKPDIIAPILVTHNKSVKEMSNTAYGWVKLICAYEAMRAYGCVEYKTCLCKAMTDTDNIIINPNFVNVNVVASKNHVIFK